MDKRYVFCGCQYPTSSGPKGNKSAWEWDIPTPIKKPRVISHSNPLLNRTTFDMDGINKRYSDNLYEPVNPPPYYGSGFLGGDPETASLDRHTFDIPPEIDIVSSEGLDGLDQPDSHAFDFDGEKEWSLFGGEDKSQPKAVFTAGIRKKHLPKYGETSSVRPLIQKGHAPSPEPNDENDEYPSSPPYELEDVEELEEPITVPENKPGNLDQLKSKAENVKKRLGQFSLSVRPKLPKWSGIKILKKKRSEGTSQDKKNDLKVYKDEEEFAIAKRSFPVTTTPAVQSDDGGGKQMKIHFDESIDLSLRTPTPELPRSEELKRKVKIDEKEESRQREILAKAAEEEELKRLRLEEKLQRDQTQEEVKRLKLEEKLQKEQAQEELKRIKVAEKAVKDKEKEEQKKVKAEEKMVKQREEEEVKKQRQAEQDELRRRKQKEEEDLKAQKELERQEQMKQKQLLAEEQRLEKQMVAKAKIDEAFRQKEAALDKLEAEIMESVFEDPAEEKEKTSSKKSLTKVEMFKRRIGDIEFTKRFKKSKTPPPRPEPPKVRFTHGPSNELANQYRREIEERMRVMEDEEESTHSGMSPIETHIFVTEPCEDMTHAEWSPPSKSRFDEDDEEADDEEVETKAKDRKIGQKLKGLGQKSKAIAAKTSKHLEMRVKVIGHDLKELGGKVSTKYQEAITEMKAQEEARRVAIEERRKEREENESVSAPTTPAGKVFRFKKRARKNQEECENETEMGKNEKPMVVGIERKIKGKLGSTFYENRHIMPETDDGYSRDSKVERDTILGRADRDWESSENVVRSRDISEERNFLPRVSSGWESPPTSSVASSAHKNGRRGVLEEIDSDEFFLREHGISEGEDEAEVNRFLVEELRHAFRPALINALDAFDFPTPPSRPLRATKKPRHESRTSNFQTFPPQRPKRKQAPRYISSYMNSQEKAEEEDAEKEFLTFDAVEEEDEDEDEGIRRVKAELRKMERTFEDDGRYEVVNASFEEEHPLRPQRSRKGKKSKKKSPPRTLYYNTIGGSEWLDDLERHIEDEPQLVWGDHQMKLNEQPVAPKRDRRKSEGGKSDSKDQSEINSKYGENETNLKYGESETNLSYGESETNLKFGESETNLSYGESETNLKFGESETNLELGETESNLKLGEIETGGEVKFPLDEIQYADADGEVESITQRMTTQGLPTLAPSESTQFEDFDDLLDLMDGNGGYASIGKVQRPTTVPRRKRQGAKSKGSSLKRRSREGVPSPQGPTVRSQIFSLPRFTPRTYHIVPPSRPHRMYSTIRPKRPPRRKAQPSKQKEELSQTKAQTALPVDQATDELKSNDEGKNLVTENRPSAAVMRGRPLPPPPRPPRSPLPMNDLDQERVESLLGVRHYANFETDEGQGWGGQEKAVLEPLCTAKNIPLLQGTADTDAGTREVNVGIQTDPLHEEDFDYNLIGSFEEDEERFQKLRDSIHCMSSDDQGEEGELEDFPPPVTREQTLQRNTAPPMEMIFPSRLHLSELEVDFLRVNEISANTLTMNHLHTPHLHVDSLSSSGPLSVISIQAGTLSTGNLGSGRLTSAESPLPSIPPPSFYHLTSPATTPTPPDPPVDDIERTLSTRLTALQAQPASASSPSPRATSQAEDDDIVELGMRLGRSLLRSGMRAIEAAMTFMDSAVANDPESEQKQKTYLQVMLCLLLLLLAGIFIMTRTAPAHPHWDFYLPPNNL